MKLKFKVNPPEHDEFGMIHDFEKTWVCFTMTVKKAPDARTAEDAFEFVEWYMGEKAEIPCALLKCPTYKKGVHTDVLTFDRDKSMTKRAQIDVIRAALDKARAAFFTEQAAAMPPFILAATRNYA